MAPVNVLVDDDDKLESGYVAFEAVSMIYFGTFGNSYRALHWSPIDPPKRALWLFDRFANCSKF